MQPQRARRDPSGHDDPDPLGYTEMPASVSGTVVAIMRLKRMLDADNARILAALGGMREADWRIMCVLSEIGAMPQKELIRRIQMEQGQASRSLRRLQDEGLVASRRDGADRRVWNFDLTEAGRAALCQVLPSMLARRDEIDAALSPAEQRELRTLLSRIAGRLAEDAPEGERSWDRTLRRKAVRDAEEGGL